MTESGGAPTTYTPDGINQFGTVGGEAPSYDGNFNLTGYHGFRL
ncbi:MAG: hypothetical protein ACR2HH_14445 [Chthoniobacterales bacterium]